MVLSRDWLVLALAAVSGLRALLGYTLAGATLTPDTGLYAQGGVGLFPSPLGRLVGNAGVHGLAALNVVAAVAIVLLVAELAASVGGSRGFAAACFVLCPLSWWTMFAGVDTIAALCVVAGLLAVRRGSVRGFAGLAAVAVGFHMAALLVVVAVLLCSRYWRVALWAVVVGLAALVVTPYAPLLLDVDPFAVSSSAAVTLVVFVLCLPVVLASGLASLRLVPVLVGCVAASGLVASQAFETNMRYTLPAVAVGSVVSSSRWAPR